MSISSAMHLNKLPPLYFRLSDIHPGMTELPFYTASGAYHGKVVYKKNKWTFNNSSNRELGKRVQSSALVLWDSCSIMQASLLCNDINFQ
ncbi:Uncharacterised protein [Escherichia coli]|nr:Uncharacterised protein [Escherichia coli]